MSYKNSNIHVPELGNQILPNNQPTVLRAIQVRCPHCSTLGTFAAANSISLVWHKELVGQRASASDIIVAQSRICPNPKCRRLVFTISKGNKSHVVYPPELISFNAENIPDSICSTLKEALQCHAAGAYRASAMMVRRLLEELCDDAGAVGRTLHDRLRGLRSQITLPEELFDAMDELKALVNDAAHIEAKAYGRIDREEAELSIELAQEILKARYQHKSLVDRLRARRATKEE